MLPPEGYSLPDLLVGRTDKRIPRGFNFFHACMGIETSAAI
jgi:hypothetical protein